MPINFPLNKPIEFKPSKEFTEWADVFASSVNFALKNPNEEISKLIMSYVDQFTSKSGDYCIMPTPEIYLQRGSIDFDFGIVTLKKLAELSVESSDNLAELHVKHPQAAVDVYTKAAKSKKKIGNMEEKK